MYELLEKEIVPLFYERDELGLPRGWLDKMKDAIRFNCPQFNTTRMVRDYALRAYFPTSERYLAISQNNYQPAKELAHWKENLFVHWYDIKINSVDFSADSEVKVNQGVQVKCQLALTGLKPEDIQVELYQGAVNDKGDIPEGSASAMTYQGPDGNGLSNYTGEIVYQSSGLQGCQVRVLPKHELLSGSYETGLILWAG